MSDFILLLGARLMGGSYIEAIHREGYRALVVDERENLDRWQGFWDDAIEIAEDLPESWVHAALAAARSRQIAAVIAYADEQVVAAAIVAQLRGLRGPGLLAASASRNKSMIRSINTLVGLPQPDSLVAPYIGLESLGGLDVNVVVQKVLGGAGSEGVQLVSKADAPIPSDTPVILEEYVIGDYFSSELFVASGEIVFTNHTSKTSGGPPEFVDLEHLVGVQLPVAFAGDATQMLRSIIAEYHISWGIVHVEWIASRDQLSVIEFAVRTPGDFLMYGIERAHGFDAFNAVVRTSLGLVPRGAAHETGCVAVSFFPTVRSNAATARRLVEDRWKDANLYIGYWREQRASGHLGSSDDRNHHVLAVASSEGDARRLATDVQIALNEHAQHGG